MNKYKIITTNQFKKDVKIAVKRGYNLKLLENVIDTLAKGENLPAKNKDHSLKGNLKEFRECHISPDWLLIYKIKESELILLLVNTGSHSDLFE